MYADILMRCISISLMLLFQDDGKFEPEDMPRGDLCTHVIFTFAGIDAVKGQLKPMNWNDLSSATTDPKGGFKGCNLSKTISFSKLTVLL